ncbi:uncharacterized protein LOC143875934 [Tasmannia lanceolata]|uniref:uncharacterized protein LOC143875934 n=1 Tax=Tasmannia lanceolata TaxID=3420 RepID=UPI004062D26D
MSNLSFSSTVELRQTLLHHLLNYKLRLRKMESVGAMNWSSFNGMISADEAEFITQLLGSYPLTNEQDSDPSLVIPPMFWSGHEATNMAGGDENSYYNYSDSVNSSLNSWALGNSNDFFVPTYNYNNYYPVESTNVIPVMNDTPEFIDLCTVEKQNISNLFEDTACLNEETSGDDLGEPGVNQSQAVSVLPTNCATQPKRKLKMAESENPMSDSNCTNPSENPKKKSRASGDVQRNAKNAQSKKNQKMVRLEEEEESNAGLNVHSSSSYSDDDLNASQELNGGVSSSSKGSSALNLNGKERAGRGSATDPQSLYARKRRERINERLRILQKLVPNGTKVDISTMLEEAVQYVKFLQLQIKLLSSDELWMYAPIAYNGMDIGLDRKISAML